MNEKDFSSAIENRDFDKLTLVFLNPEFLNIPSVDMSFAYLSKDNYFEGIQLFLKNKTLDPSFSKNLAIREAIKISKHLDIKKDLNEIKINNKIIVLLFSNKKIRDKLYTNNNDLYKEISVKYITNNINEF